MQSYVDGAAGSLGYLVNCGAARPRVEIAAKKQCIPFDEARAQHVPEVENDKLPGNSSHLPKLQHRTCYSS